MLNYSHLFNGCKCKLNFVHLLILVLDEFNYFQFTISYKLIIILMPRIYVTLNANLMKIYQTLTQNNLFSRIKFKLKTKTFEQHFPQTLLDSWVASSWPWLPKFLMSIWPFLFEQREANFPDQTVETWTHPKKNICQIKGFPFWEYLLWSVHDIEICAKKTKTEFKFLVISLLEYFRHLKNDKNRQKGLTLWSIIMGLRRKYLAIELQRHPLFCACNASRCSRI